MRRLHFLAPHTHLLVLPLALLAAACGEDEQVPGGQGGSGGHGLPECSLDSDPPQRSMTGQWLPVEPDGAVCADGSQYRFFVKFAERSHDLAITLEPGGACWDYSTCTGGAGVLSAANLDGVSPDHMTALPPPYGEVEGAIPWGLMYPHLGEADQTVATREFHQVFFPYCTADAFSGALERTYEDAETDATITIQHRGRENLERALPWLTETFPEVARLHVTGASAGGLGAMLNYVTFRDALEPRCGSLINDSGPLFAPGGPQTEARAQFVERWDVSSFAQDLDVRLEAPDDQTLASDIGHLSALLSRAFPDDRFLSTHFLRDLNNSLFCYEGFFEPLPTERVFELWEEDTHGLVAELEPLANWGWYFPGFRADNCSHTVSLVPLDELADEPNYALSMLSGTADGYLRTDLGSVDFGEVLRSVVERKELPRLMAETVEGEFTAEREASCRDTGE